MSYVTLKKFPITAPDGTQYRATIEEINPSDSFLHIQYVEASLYVKCKWIGYRKLYTTTFSDGRGIYNASCPDFIAISKELLREYYHHLRNEQEEKQRLAQEELNKKRSVREFIWWDGKVEL
ncbi:hypothetical protein M5X17_27805 [Paenibacillus alvei]|uniref:hypothetical protein n=1 Tax=Paenibacillus alvei TaxID=44250 RepID=UPI00228130F8|nr:hypothetical protein [Paenibacillus alvei]MCY9737512.1 hypothetical protein [Paenibacillus alvei]